ncbi:MAG: glycoside hydrolase family 3 C-terminal domain-containing protein, partial [Oscillospiraceae bacterium]
MYQIKLKKRAIGVGKVTAVSIVGEQTLQVPQGEGVSLAANVEGTGAYDPFVVWSVSDENDQPVASKIEENGFLRIALTEKAKKLKVIASARTPETDAKGEAVPGADAVASSPVTVEITASGDSGAAVAKEIAKEGMVLLKNDNNVLPLKKSEAGKAPHIAMLGLGQVHYIKGGEGSGEVYSPYQRTLIDGMKIMEEKGSVTIDSRLLEYYESLPAMPINRNGMNTPEPEMSVIQPLMNAAVAQDSDTVAIVTLRRLSGEGWDINIKNDGAKNGYYLSNDEKELVTSALNTFKHVVVLLNIGVVIDTDWIVKAQGNNGEKIDSLLLTWQPGIEGGVAMAEILCGEVNPSGKLSDTFATSYDAYPSSKSYTRSNIAYEEDIFVGYRYFETMAKDDVVFPFGYGLSYTDFSIKTNKVTNDGKNIDVSVTVENTGALAGKEVVQVYYSAPKGKLPQPAIELAAFKKTKLLQPGEKETLHLIFAIKDMASFDDVGKTGKESAWVLEEGSYRIYVGNSVRSTVETDAYVVDKLTVVEQLEKKLQPVNNFGYKKLSKRLDGTAKDSFETNVWNPQSSFLKTLYQMFRKDSAYKMELPNLNQSGGLDKKIAFSEVVKAPDKMSSFISQLSARDLLKLSFGTGYAWNEIEDAALKGPDNIIDGANTACTWDIPEFGIPRAQTADGPAGIRSNTKKTTAFPNATMQACTWNPDLVLKGGAAGAREAKNFSFKQPQFSSLSTNPGYSIWLTPGMNIHRDPQCGRNFEYYSEDPYLTGVMASAQVAGIQSENVAATAKHFAANNIEENRKGSNSMMSERALREIYLKGFEMLVKSESQPWCIMSSYNLINGVKASENEELLTDILRKEWGFKGLVMSDWSNCGDLTTEIIAGEALKMPGAGEMRNEWDEAENPNFDPTGGRSDGPEYQQAIKALEKGDLPRTVIEDNIRSLLHMLSLTFLYDGAGQSAAYNQIVPKKGVDAKAQYTLYYEKELVRVYAPGIRDLVALDANGTELNLNSDTQNKWWYTFEMPSTKVTLSTRGYIEDGDIDIDDDINQPQLGEKI